MNARYQLIVPKSCAKKRTQNRLVELFPASLSSLRHDTRSNLIRTSIPSRFELNSYDSSQSSKISNRIVITVCARLTLLTALSERILVRRSPTFKFYDDSQQAGKRQSCSPPSHVRSIKVFINPTSSRGCDRSFFFCFFYLGFAVQIIMSTRRTRAHPSPGGLKSLPIDPPKRTRRQPTKPKQAPAAAPEGVISSENTITIDHRPSPSPAPPTSRSQSPHILESDSQSAVIESRSSSPPTDDKGHWTRSQTASTSPQAKRPTTQLPKRKSKKATPKTTTKNTRKRTRSQRTAPAPTVIGSFPDDNEAEAAGSVSAEENIVVEDRSSQALEPFEPEPSAEKTPVRKFAKGRQSRNQSSDINGHLRSGERRPVQRKSTDFLQAGDTSDSDLADEERAPKRTKLEANKYSPRNSSSRKPHSRQPSATNSPLNQGAKQLPVTAETSRSLVLANPDGTQVAHPRRDLSQLIGQRDSPSKHLTPRSMRRIFSTPKAPVDDGDRQGPTKVIGTLPKDGDQRLQLWMDAYKIKPESLTSYRRAARAKVNSDSGDDDDEAADSGDEYEQLTRSLPPQRSDRRIFPRKRIPFDISEGPGGNNTVRLSNLQRRFALDR